MGMHGVDQYGWTHLHQVAHAGRIPIAYHLVRGDSPALAQARHFLARVALLDSSIGAVGVMADAEDADDAPPWDRESYAKILVDFLGVVCASTSRRCLVYGSGAYLEALALPPSVADLPLMLADWTPPATVPAPWERWTIHQYAVKMHGGRLIDHDRFEGSIADLRQALGLVSQADEMLGALAERVRSVTAPGVNEGPAIPDD